jgi:hypothetical protein
MLNGRERSPQKGAFAQQLPGLLMLLALPALTTIAYGLALAFEFGTLDAYHAPRMLAKVELGQLIVPGAIALLLVGVVLFYATAITVLVDLYRRTPFTKVLVWLALTSFFLGFGLWGLVALGLVVVMRQGWHAKRHRYTWQTVSGLYLVASIAVLFAIYHDRFHLRSAVVVMLWAGLAFTALLFMASGLTMHLHAKSKPVPRTLGILARTPAAMDFGLRDDFLDLPRISLALGAVVLGLVVLTGSIIGTYRLGAISSHREYANVISGPHGEKEAIIRLYDDRAIVGVFDPQTNRLTGKWRAIKYSDSTPLEMTIEQRHILPAQ